jgi:hypothetical protein
VRIYKWLIGLVSAIFFIMIIAWLSSYFYTPATPWYGALVKPRAMLKPLSYDICEIVVYLFTALALAKLIVKRKFNLAFFFILAAGLLSVVFLVCFFSLHSLFAAAAVLAAVLVLDTAVLLKALFNDPLCAAFYAPIFAWHIYLFCTTVFIALHN